MQNAGEEVFRFSSHKRGDSPKAFGPWTLKRFQHSELSRVLERVYTHVHTEGCINYKWTISPFTSFDELWIKINEYAPSLHGYAYKGRRGWNGGWVWRCYLQSCTRGWHARISRFQWNYQIACCENCAFCTCLKLCFDHASGKYYVIFVFDTCSEVAGAIIRLRRSEHLILMFGFELYYIFIIFLVNKILIKFNSILPII